MKKLLRMAIKSVAQDGSFEGSLAVYNNLDLGGDLIEPGAFTKTIQDHGNEVPLLWQHKTDKPIGKLTLVDGPAALSVKGQLLMDLPDARNAYLLIKAKIVKGLSIGFDTVKDAMDGATRRLKEVRLWEGSIVTFPMNEQALITSVKRRREAKEKKEDFDTEYAEALLQDAAYQMWIALRSALCAIPWSADLSKEEKLAASEESIQQFLAAYMAMLPAYIDWLAEEYGDMTYYGRQPGEVKELKTGKTISAATKKTIGAATDHMTKAGEHQKSASDILTALCTDEAADDDPDADTSEGKAAATRVTEPATIDHSAANQTLIEEIRSLIPAA
jgi:HK97 family phage prohead protease